MTTNPSQILQESIDASNAVYSVSTSPPVSPLRWIGTDASHVELTAVFYNQQPLYLADPSNGFYAQAFFDNSGSIIIAYEGSFPDPRDPNFLTTYGINSNRADLQLAAGLTPTALSEASLFAKEVHVDFSSATIYVTGHSLGAAEAEEAAWQNSFIAGGYTFAAPGLPGYTGPSNGSLIDYVDSGDPIGNYAKDTSSYALAGNHYGTVVRADSSITHFLARILNIHPNLSEIVTAAEFHPLANYANDLHLTLAISSSGITPQPQLISSDQANYIASVVQSSPVQHTTPSYPVVVGPSTASASVNKQLFLSSLFTGSESPAGSSHQVDHYSIFVVSGSGSMVVGNQSYSLGAVATNVLVSQFASAYFTAASAGTDEIAVVAIDDAGTSSVAADTVITVSGQLAPITAVASVNEPINTTFLLQPFLSLPAPPSGKTVSLVNFINTHTRPGQLTNGGVATSGNIAVAYSSVGQIGFATGSIIGSDKIETYATYSDGTVSNTVDLTINIQTSSAPIPPPQTSSGPVVGSGLQALQVTIGQTGTFSALNLNRPLPANLHHHKYFRARRHTAQRSGCT